MLLLADGPAQSTKPFSRQAQKGRERSSAPSKGSVPVPPQQGRHWGANGTATEGKAGPHGLRRWWTQRPPAAARWLQQRGAGPWEVPTPLPRADGAPGQGLEHKLKKTPFQLELRVVLAGLSSPKPARWLSPVPRELHASPGHPWLGPVPLGTESPHRCPAGHPVRGPRGRRPPHAHLFRELLAHQSHDQRCLPHLG